MYGVSLHETETGRWWLPDGVETDIVIQAMRAGRVFEPEVVETVARYSRPGSVILDVGSNFGQMAVLFSRITGPEGTVHAFEADPFTFELLQKNIAENSCAHNIIAHPGAIWHESGLSLIYPEPDFSRFGSFGSFGIDPRASEGRRVESLTIDSLDIQGDVSVIKVDVQGSDLNALRGAVQTIERCKPAIIFEYEVTLQEQFGTCLADYEALIADIGYRIEQRFAHNYIILPV